MNKLACFIILSLAASAAFEVLAPVEGNNDLPKFEMPRKALPFKNVITSIIVSARPPPCHPEGAWCEGYLNPCCAPFVCVYIGGMDSICKRNSL